MAFWEFLIQKEGDRSWLPLESPTVEILEGRYRVVARANRINAPVEIRIVHNAITEDPPVRRIQKRSSKTNKDGLIVILPFTRLSPGAWELRCTGDLMTDMMGQGWSYAVQLQVLSLEPDAEEDWEPDWEDPAPTQADSSTAVSGLAITSVQPTETVLSSIFPALHSADATASDPAEALAPEAETKAASKAAHQPAESPAAIGNDALQKLTAAGKQAYSLSLKLDQTSYVVHRGQPLVLNGQVEPLENGSDEIAIAPSTLRVRLFDPRTSNMLVDETHSVTVAGLPCPVSIAVALPAKCETYLLLGELVLYGLAPEGSLPPVLASQSFNVATDLLNLLETIANDFAESDELPAPEQAPPQSSSHTNTAVLPLPRATQPLQFRPAIQQPLPPQLHPADPHKARRSLDLPSFDPAILMAEATAPESEDESDPAVARGEIAHSAHADEIAPTDEVAPTAAPAVERSDAELKALETSASAPLEIPELTEMPALMEEPRSSQPLAQPDRAVSSDLPVEPSETAAPDSSEKAAPEATQILIGQEEGWVDPSVDWAIVDRPVPLWQRQKVVSTAELSKTPEDAAFRALNLQERFLTRLQALASDAELADWLNSLETAPTQELPANAETTALFTQRHQVQPTSLDADLAAQEIVIDDPPLLELFAEEKTAEEKTAATPSQTAIALADEPLIAPPQLDIPAGELISGQTITVSVKLLDTYARVYTKLWMHDRQSRTLLDGPHWLMDFVPDGLGNQITKGQIMVPFGCVEVQFEAIAIDMATQQESDKTIVIRSVIPPDLTVITIDELGI